MEMFCSECGIELTPETAIVLDTGELICTSCIHNGRDTYGRCDRCGRWYKRTNGGCSHCKSTVYDRVLNSYGTKPEPIFMNKKGIGYNGNRFYGLEIELNNVTPSFVYYVLQDLYRDKKLYNKADGSISNGVEIVTNPCDYSSAKKLLEDMNRLFSVLDNKKTEVSAGVHIHVNRKTIDPIDTHKLFYLFNTPNSNHVINNMFLYIVGRHKTSTVLRTLKDSYCKLGKGCLSEIVKNKVNSERHSAINLKNSNTIEFRMFKSTTDYKAIQGYLEIVNLAIDFCHESPLNKISLNNFIIYLKNNAKNDIILKRIKNFEKYRGMVEPKDNTYKFDVTILKGVSFQKYPKIAEIMRSYRNNDIITQEILSFLNRGSRSINMPYIMETNKYKNNLADKLEDTYKKVLINTILKEVKECA